MWNSIWVCRYWFASGVRTYPAIILEGEASLKSSFWRTIKEFAGARLLSSRKTGSAPRYAFIISYERLRFGSDFVR